jgi:branched-chain amino acid transport system substrate-binding protein
MIAVTPRTSGTTREISPLNHRTILPLCALIIAGCGGSTRPITIAAAGPWTQAGGAITKQGIELAVDEINRGGGIRGRRLDLITRDDSGNGAKAAAVAQEFVANREIVGVVGHVNSGAMVSAARVYDGHLVAIATTATSPELTGISPWVFRVISSDSTNGVVIARFASDMGRRRAVVLYENDSYGRGLADAFRRSFAGDVVSMDPISGGTTDIEPYIAYYRTKHPDIVFVAGVDVTGIATLREAHRQHLAVDFVGGDGWARIIADTAAAEGAYVGTPFTADDPRPEVKRFVTAFESRYHMVPDLNAALGYDATRLLVRAIDAAGDDRAAVRRYLASLDERTAYLGVTGPIRFLPTGDPARPAFHITRVHNGAFLIAGGAGR